MFVALAMLPGFANAQASGTTQSSPILDSAQPIETRVADLIAQMTLEDRMEPPSQRHWRGATTLPGVSPSRYTRSPGSPEYISRPVALSA